MERNPNFRDMLSALKDENVRFLVVGAYAVMYHAEPRYTKDLDLWIEPTRENAERVWNALRSFGAPLRDIEPEDFTDERMVYSVGVEPSRIDVLMGVDGVRFETAWKNRVSATYAEVPIDLLSRADLIRAKLAAGRPQDMLDVERLRAKRTKSQKQPQRRRKQRRRQ